MSKRSIAFKVTRVVLRVLLVVIPLMIITVAVAYNSNFTIIQNIFFLLIASLIVYILINLKSIVDTVPLNPFCEANVSRFKAIGFSILGIGLVHLVETFPEQNGAVLIGTPYGSIHMSVLIFVIMGFLSLLLSEIFAEALKIKNENDMTV